MSVYDDGETADEIYATKELTIKDPKIKTEGIIFVQFNEFWPNKRGCGGRETTDPGPGDDFKQSFRPKIDGIEPEQ